MAACTKDLETSCLLFTGWKLGCQTFPENKFWQINFPYTAKGKQLTRVATANMKLGQ
jgi:hypothetical protein